MNHNKFVREREAGRACYVLINIVLGDCRLQPASQPVSTVSVGRGNDGRSREGSQPQLRLWSAVTRNITNTALQSSPGSYCYTLPWDQTVLEFQVAAHCLTNVAHLLEQTNKIIYKARPPEYLMLAPLIVFAVELTRARPLTRLASINWSWWISTEISGLLAGIKFMLLFLAAVAAQQNEWIYLFSFEVHWCQFLDDYVPTTGPAVCLSVLSPWRCSVLWCGDWRD